MTTPQFSDINHGLRVLNLRWAQYHHHNVPNRLISLARSAPDKRSAERAIQELLLHYGCNNPMTGAARFVDGPLAHLVGLDHQEKA